MTMIQTPFSSSTTDLDLPVHPAATLFPMLSDLELQEFADDIRKHGLLAPVVVHEGQVLDGRNRLAACRLVGIQPRTVSWKPQQGETPVSYCLSANLHRRHLSVGQRAALACEVEPFFAEEARQRIVAGAQKGGIAAAAKRVASVFSDPSKVPASKSSAPLPCVAPFRTAAADASSYAESVAAGRSRDIAAKALRVSSGYVGDAKNLKKADPEAFEKVRTGEMTLPQAQRYAINQASVQGLLERSVLRPGVKRAVEVPRRKIKPATKFGKVESSKIELTLNVMFGSPTVAEDVLLMLDKDPRVLGMTVRSDDATISREEAPVNA